MGSMIALGAVWEYAALIVHLYGSAYGHCFNERIKHLLIERRPTDACLFI